jgi:hypothetical protein
MSAFLAYIHTTSSTTKHVTEFVFLGTRGSFPGVKRPGREADHSPPSSAAVKEWVELYPQSPNTPSWRHAQLKHRDNFTFTLPLCILDAAQT